MLKVAVLINRVDQQYEGLRTSRGLLLYNTEVLIFILHHEIANIDEASRENMELLEEMESERFSDIQSNEP